MMRIVIEAMEKIKNKRAIVLGILSGLFIVSVCICILVNAVGEVRSNLYGKNVPTKEDAFKIFLENQDEFELLAENVKEIFFQNGEHAISIKGKIEYKLNGLKSDLLTKYPIKEISIYDAEKSIKIIFYFEIESNSVTGIQYNSNNEPSFWGEDKGTNIEEVDGVYTKTGSYYIYETEKIREYWYYFHADVW